MKNKDIQSALVISSNIKQLDYDPFMQTMTVGFAANSIYEYYGVPPELYKQLIEAKSVGKFFLSNVKDKFEFAKRGKLVNHADPEEESE